MADASWWRPSPEWRGLPVIVVATGPSLSLAQIRHVALRRMANACRVVAVNDAVFAAWFADLCFGGDGKWWNARAGVPGFNGIRAGLAESRSAKEITGIRYLHRAGSEGCSLESGLIFSNSNSGAMATQVAAQFGGEPIGLVGFDMHQENGRHFFGPYEQQNLQSKADMNVWVENFKPIAHALKGRLFSATPGSALNAFIPEASLDQLIGRVHGNAG